MSQAALVIGNDASSLKLREALMTLPQAQGAGEMPLLLLLLRPMTTRWQTRMTLMMVGGCDNVLPLNELNAMPFS